LIREAEGVPEFRGPYGPNPPLSELQLRTFETAHGISLPVEYREFLLHVGNGGQWPWLFLESFGGMEAEPWHSWDVHPGAMAEPFPLTSAWNDPSGEPEYRDELEGDPEYERERFEWLEQYFNPALLNGAIPLHNHGESRHSWLVVTGTSAGEIWFDKRADRLGLYPLTNWDGERVSFTSWMLLRVDHARRLVLGSKPKSTSPTAS
jgi:hypothetical protein